MPIGNWPATLDRVYALKDQSGRAVRTKVMRLDSDYLQIEGTRWPDLFEE